MIRELVNQLQSDNNLAWGECYVVHVGPDGEVNPDRSISVRNFIRDWHHLPGADDANELIANGQYVNHRWLGVVHEDGMCITIVETHPKQFTFGDDNEPADWWKQQ